MDDTYPFGASAAAQTLQQALDKASRERGLSLRDLARRLGYKQAVVLSHMARGRVPIPIDRAGQLATQLEIDPTEFLQQVLEQRFPEIAWSAIFAGDRPSAAEGELVEVLQTIARRPLDELSAEQKLVMREVVADPHPARRWLSVHELAAMELLRNVVPDLATAGLTRSVAEALRGAARSPISSRSAA